MEELLKLMFHYLRLVYKIALCSRVLTKATVLLCTEFPLYHYLYRKYCILKPGLGLAADSNIKLSDIIGFNLSKSHR